MGGLRLTNLAFIIMCYMVIHMLWSYTYMVGIRGPYASERRIPKKNRRMGRNAIGPIEYARHKNSIIILFSLCDEE